METLLKGIGVGFAVAAPVGPIGLLCIKRTVDHGRAVGLASGMGAATADALYGIMVATGLAVTGLLVSYAVPLKLFGGLLIVFLGVMSVRSFFSKTVESVAPAAEAKHVLRAFSTTFALTVSNPMTILAFVALISGLGTSASANPNAPYWLVLGIFLGSALWWLLLVQAALLARSRMTFGVTRYLDLLSGLILLIWGIWIATSAIKMSL